MSTTTVTLEELESERADLLPSRETLHCCHPCGCGGGVVIAVGVRLPLDPPRLALGGPAGRDNRGAAYSGPGRAARPHPGGPPSSPRDEEVKPREPFY